MAKAQHLLELLEQSASSNGRILFLSDRRCHEHTLADVWVRAASAGANLRDRAGPDGVVALVLDASPACLVTLIGAWRAGLTVASLPYPSRGTLLEEYRAEVEGVCRTVGAETLVVASTYIGLLPELDAAHTVAYEDCLDARRPIADGEVGRLVQFTGGSTGAPKGVVLSLNGVAANILALLDVLQPGPTDVACSWLPLSHDMGLIGMCLSSLVAFGDPWKTGTLVLMAPEEFLANPVMWLQAWSDHGATVTCAPNFALELCARRLGRPAQLDLTRMRVLITGAEPVRAESLRRFSNAAGRFGFSDLAFCPAYGLAEATLGVTMVAPERSWRSARVNAAALGAGRWVASADEGSLELVSTGVPLPTMGVRVDAGLDADIGIVEVTGPSLLEGYLGAVEPQWRDGWLRSNDLGAVVDGELFVLGRSDDVIVIAGRNVYATDLEATVSAHPAVRTGNAAVLPADDGGYYIVLAEPAHPSSTADELAAAAAELRARLARRVGTGPSSVVFIERGRLPKTSSGKLRRTQAAAAIRTGALPVVHDKRFGRTKGS